MLIFVYKITETLTDKLLIIMDDNNDFDPVPIKVIVPGTSTASAPDITDTTDTSVETVVTTPVVEPTPAATNTTSTETEDNLIEIDGKPYKLDTNGNALNEDGTVKLSKTQIDEFSNTQTSTDLKVEDIIARINYSPVDDKGTPITYDSTPDGIASLFKDAVEQLSISKAQTQLDEYVSANPDRQRALDYIDRNGSLAGIESNVDYSTINIASADEQTKMNMIIAREMDKGETLEEARSLANMYKDANQLDSRVTKAKEYFDNKASEANAVRVAQQEQAVLESNRTWSEIKTKINNRKLEIGSETIVIPEVLKVKAADGKVENRTSDDFFAYINTPKTFTVNGKNQTLTQNQYDEMMEISNRKIDDAIFEGLKRFTKYNNEQFVKSIAKAQTVKSIKTISTTNNKGNSNPRIATIK